MNEPFWASGPVTLFQGDCIEVMQKMGDASVDSVVTDPPYGLGFMGKKWDQGKSFFERSAQRSNTFDHVGGNHNPANSRDQQRTRLKENGAFGDWCEEWSREALRVLKPGGFMVAFGGSRTWHRLAAGVEDAGFEVRDSIAWLYGSGMPKGNALLKPAFEPIVLARKPLLGTVAANVVEFGTGALNIDATRTEATDKQLAEKYASVQKAGARENSVYGLDTRDRAGAEPHSAGRWPTNVLLDEHQAEALDAVTATLQGGVTVRRNRDGSVEKNSVYGTFARRAADDLTYGDSGGASRFFPTFRYEAKAPTSERPLVDGTSHPTVKPLSLMRWLVRLTTPPGGVILDPFAGSGTTLEAAAQEGFDVVGIEREVAYLPLIKSRFDKPVEQVLDLGDIA